MQKENALQNLNDGAATADALDRVMATFQRGFSSKLFSFEQREPDVLMRAFGITWEQVEANRQYWLRQLGACWEILVKSACSVRSDYGSAPELGSGGPCDFILGRMGVEMKYRVGSGDSKTLAAFRDNGRVLQASGLVPVMAILREDSLSSALSACRNGGWEIYAGKRAFDFVRDESGFDIEEWLIANTERFLLTS